MARQRDYAAEYARRQERAAERGFRSYSEERRYREGVRQGPAPEAALTLTQGRKINEPGALQRFIADYRPGSMKREQLQDRIKDLLQSTPFYSTPPMPEGMDFEEYLEFYGDDTEGGGDETGDLFPDTAFDEWDETDWDAFFESDAWYDFLDELYADK